MKNKTFILITVLFSSTLTLGQTKNDAKALYKANYEMTIGDSSNLSQQSRYDLTLLFNTSSSAFFDAVTKQYYEDIKKKNFNIQSGAKLSVIKKNGVIKTFLPINRDIYSYTEPILKWELIHSKSKKIGNYGCLLAKCTTDTGKIYYAWYTTEIPISEGPFRFKGLPGLILEVYNLNKTICFTLTSLSKSAEIIEELEYIRVYSVDKKKFLLKREQEIENPNSSNYTSSNIKFFSESGEELKVSPPKKNTTNRDYLLD